MNDQTIQKFKKAEKLFSKKSYNELLKYLCSLFDEGIVTSRLLVMFGISVQLIDQNSKYPLSDAKKAFQKAIEIDKYYIDGYIELAFFLLNVEDEELAAKELFNKVVKLIDKKKKEIVISGDVCRNPNSV